MILIKIRTTLWQCQTGSRVVLTPWTTDVDACVRACVVDGRVYS